MRLNTSNCHPKNLPLKRRIALGGTSDPATVDVVIIGNLDILGVYSEAKAYIKQVSGGIIDLKINFIQDPLIELQVKAFIGYYGISILQEMLFFGQSPATMKQMIYDPKKYQELYKMPFYSMAYYGGQGNVQYSQIVCPTVWTEPLHEWYHGWYSYFNLPDRTHEIINKYGGWAQKAFPEIIGEFVKVWPKQEPMILGYVSTS